MNDLTPGFYISISGEVLIVVYPEGQAEYSYIGDVWEPVVKENGWNAFFIRQFYDYMGEL